LLDIIIIENKGGVVYMKEATGELNMTVITVVAIAAVAAIFYAFIWPSIKTTIQTQSICANGPSYEVGVSSHADYVKCGAVTQSTGTYQCTYNAESNGSLVSKTVTCKTK